jgi:DNA replication factor GINS
MDPNKIQNLIKIDEIHNVLKREIQLTNGPQPIPQNLYQNIANLVYLLNEQNERDELEFSIQEEENEDEDNEDNDSDTTTTTADAATTAISKQINSELITMIAKLTSLLFILRCKKIFNSSKSSPESFEYSNLTDEEKYVFFGNREREKRIDVILKMLLDGKPKTLEKIVSSINENFVIVRFLDSMDQFVGVNMNKYGPFKKDDVAILPFENARPILESNKAVEIRKLV